MNLTECTSASENSDRRLDRMKTWIDLAEKKQFKGYKYVHVRFIFYWIAYEAASGAYRKDGNYDNRFQRERFHKSVTRFNPNLKIELQRIYRKILKLMELRQSDDLFWHKRKQNCKTNQDWEEKFEDRTSKSHSRLFNGIETSIILDDLFSNLNVVRNQIVHGGSSGIKSFGRDQVVWGEELLSILIPIFHQTMESHQKEDWGKPPFPRVGDKANEKIPPPWLNK